MKKLILNFIAGIMVMGAATASAGCCKAEAGKDTASCPATKAAAQCPADKVACTEKTEANCPMKGQKGCPKTEAKAAAGKTGCCPSKTAQRKIQRASAKGAEHLNTL